MGAGMSCMNETGANGNRVSVENDGTIYHEKQSKELCALHALNNLFQNEKAYSKKDLDDICYKLSPLTYINPHKSMFGLGNYDINVIMAALQQKNYETVWFDKRKDLAKLSLDSIEGFILNIPTDYKWGMVKFPIKRKHWIAIREVGQHYYNLDSKIDAPEVIGGRNELIQYLRDQVRCCEKELLLVVSSEVAQEGSWYDNENSSHEQKSPSGESAIVGCHEKDMADVKTNIEGLKLSENNTRHCKNESAQDDDPNENRNVAATQPASIKVNCKPTVSNTNSKTSALNGDIRRAASPASKYEVTSCDRKNSDTELTSHS